MLITIALKLIWFYFTFLSKSNGMCISPNAWVACNWFYTCEMNVCTICFRMAFISWIKCMLWTAHDHDIDCTSWWNTNWIFAFLNVLINWVSCVSSITYCSIGALTSWVNTNSMCALLCIYQLNEVLLINLWLLYWWPSNLLKCKLSVNSVLLIELVSFTVYLTSVCSWCQKAPASSLVV